VRNISSVARGEPENVVYKDGGGDCHVHLPGVGLTTSPPVIRDGELCRRQDTERLFDRIRRRE
jgi:hypothetical protein